tara:strand:- start:733 stop:1272 length:540 start_codon:yes stop_codon:yes gene_type:complete
MSSELRVDRIVPTGGIPTGGGGGVIQVVQKLFTTQFTSSVYVYADVTGFSVDITPKFNTSKILCFGHISGQGTSNTRALYRLLRTISGGSGVPLGEGTGSIGNRAPCIGTIYRTDSQSAETFGYSVLDSPSTTSSINYKIQISNGNNSDQSYVNRSSSWSNTYAHGAPASSLTLMEISA